MGLNITPYDEDDTSAAGTTTLRHIDLSTRMAWSTFGSVQSDPYRWGHATLPGYTPPAAADDAAARTSRTRTSTGRLAADDRQSARNGVPISGRVPAHSDLAARTEAAVGAFSIDVDSAGTGTPHVFL
jgi:hypothetical protein